MIIELVDIIGGIKNDTNILGKAFLFNVIYNEYKFDCILFVHPIKPTFVSLTNEIKKLNIENQIIESIFEIYDKETLLNTEI